MSRMLRRGIILAAEHYNDSLPVNLGSGDEISIRSLVETISRLTDFEGEIFWNSDRPNNQPRRALDTTRSRQLFGFRPRTTLEEGLRQTTEWYRQRRAE